MLADPASMALKQEKERQARMERLLEAADPLAEEIIGSLLSEQAVEVAKEAIRLATVERERKVSDDFLVLI